MKVKVHPSSRVDRHIKKAEHAFDVYVRSAAQAGKANEACLRLVSLHLNVPVGKIWIVKGARKPNKILRVIK